MNRTGQKVKIRYSIQDRIFHYTGEIVSEDHSFIAINDCKEGIIELNKNSIISIKEVD